MLIYRVETSDGMGMYQGGLGVPWPNCHYRNKHSHKDEPIKHIEWYGRRHGFDSMDMMFEWFHRKLEHILCMHEREYRLIAYDAPSEYVYIGTKQVLFSAAHATRLGEISWNVFAEWAQKTLDKEHKESKCVSTIAPDFKNEWMIPSGRLISTETRLSAAGLRKLGTSLEKIRTTEEKRRQYMLAYGMPLKRYEELYAKVSPEDILQAEPQAKLEQEQGKFTSTVDAPKGFRGFRNAPWYSSEAAQRCVVSKFN